MTDFDRDDKAPEKYRLLTTAEKWKWHAGVYAFRRVVLNASRDERTSPCDPDGKWFNEQMVDDAERALRLKGKMRSRSYREGKQYGSDAAGGRAIKEGWCQKHGYRDFKDFMAKSGLNFDNDEDYAKACVQISESILKAAVLKNRDAFQEKKVEPFDVAKTLGVKAREFNPSAEELRAGRIALGLERDIESEAAE